MQAICARGWALQSRHQHTNLRTSHTATAAHASRGGTARIPPGILNVVALDVEYMHYRRSRPGGPPGSQEHACAAWVALVDDSQQTVLKTECRPKSLPADFVWVGGVPMERLHGAPPVQEVACRVQQLANGKRLIGHGLLKDLQALGIADHPDTYDTMCFPLFQNKSGSARTLGYLAAEHLGLKLHTPGQKHDPEEDAAALMQLYTRCVHPRLISDYGLLVQWHTRKTMEQISLWQQHNQQQQ
ncbi:hypothetical protein DUNSADRAFT_5189 [Dunaliella salina]|uniref:Exonuclease domain-containing protein n=1 Tax=Dunaliella salina TaxID=3046 RepID=A0ABQ7GQS3_DUNSA|nr:hypothetical protein DUNSADRAFT_5189 [Dunaliella salina]|eukprot:KAF5836960.1 hypothetical protein DUNSADRAFT_5189 [Dunaliella salina]